MDKYIPRYKEVIVLFEGCDDRQVAYERLRKVEELDPDVVGLDFIQDATRFVSDRFRRNSGVEGVL